MDENDLESVIDNVGGMRDENINISDVIEVIETDPDFKRSTMFNGGGEISQPSVPQVAQSRRQAYVRIVEQPASKALRFRYECEGRSAGSIPGASSTPENKTFPAIQVVGYQGRAVVVVSCVTKDAPYRPHPHNLVGREGCRKGVCTLEVSPETMTVTFSNLGIQCVKKKDIESALKLREEIRVDPYKTGFGHRNQPTSIDLNAVRLCFQVFLEGDHMGKFTVPLTPVVSEPIFDKKAMSDLLIVKLSDCVSYVDGGRKDIILLCEKVTKEDIQIRFYEEKDGQVVWEGFGDFQPSQVHKQTAIWFRTPRYRTLDVTEPVKVFIQLRRPSDGASSESIPFELLPLDSEPGALKRKRQKFENDPAHMLRQLQEHEKNRSVQPFNLLNIPMETVKTEPRDNSPGPTYVGGQMYGSPLYVPNPAESPQQYRLPLDQQVDVQFNLPCTSQTTGINQPSTSSDVLGYFYQNTSDNPLSKTSLPSIQQVLPQSWNIPTSLPATVTSVNVLGGTSAGELFDSASGISSLLDLDSQQLHQINLNSGDLNMLDADTNNLSETFSSNLSLTDINVAQRTDHNMTDSLTRLANTTLDNICQLNDMYKQSQQ